MENLFNNVELERELSTFAYEVLNDNDIDFTEDDANDVAQFIIECLCEKAKEKKSGQVFFGLSDKTVAEYVLKAVDYLDDWRKEKAQAQKKQAADKKKAEVKQTKAIEKIKTEKPRAVKKEVEIKLPETTKTAQRFVQMEIDFDNY